MHSCITSSLIAASIRSAFVQFHRGVGQATQAKWMARFLWEQAHVFLFAFSLADMDTRFSLFL